MKYIAALFALLGLVAPALADTTAPQAPASSTSTRVAVTGWHLECDPTATASLACHVLNQITQAPNGGLVIGLTFTPAAEGKTTLSMVVPLGASIRIPVALAIAGGPSQNFPYLFCSQQGCYATGAINGDLLAAMKAGKGDLKITYTMLDNNLGEHGITASLSLTGFAEVAARLK